MHLEISEAAKKIQQDLNHLKEDHFTAQCCQSVNSLAVLAFKLLIISGAIFFGILCAFTFPFDLAFISITALLALTASLFIGAEKIIKLFTKKAQKFENVCEKSTEL